MAFTQTDIDNLNAAIASSELEVQLEGRRVKFDTFDELRKRLAFIEQHMATTTRRTGSYRYNMTTQRGD